LADNKAVGDVLRELGGDSKSSPAVIKPAGTKLVATYYYRNAAGKPSYKVCRYEPKTFRPFHLTPDGKTVAGLEGVSRVLYNLPEVLDAEMVLVVEGEKDADALNALDLGAVATTNCSGAESWLDSYADSLRDKQVVLIPDRDEKGEKHAQKVAASVLGKAKSVKRVDLPHPHKDAADYIAAVGPDVAREKLAEMICNAKKLRVGGDLPFKDIHELESEYRDHVAALATSSIDLARWLPSLGCLRKLVAGDLVAILADTGSGKTALMVNLIVSANPIPTLSFELELGEAMTFERFVQCDTGNTGFDIERAYQAGQIPDWKSRRRLEHFLHCTDTRLTPDKIEELIEKSELRLGQRPMLVTVDYIGLLDDKGGDRYEKLSNIAEKLRLIARRTKTVMVITSQIKRKQDADNTTPIGLHDAKNSGSIESSASVVIGAWRDANEAEKMTLRVLKASRGGAGTEVICNFSGKTMQITERINANV
jgi:5S rRNA maturation endonuclease (ribonuclease M5)